MWVTYAFLSALFAALVSIFGKLGLKAIDPTMATAIRGIIMALIVATAAISLGKFKGFSIATLSGKEWLYIILAGVAGALSWIAYFYALSVGEAGPVGAIDKLSIVLTIILAGIFLGESLTIYKITGAILISIGTILVAVPIEKLKIFFSSISNLWH